MILAEPSPFCDLYIFWHRASGRWVCYYPDTAWHHERGMVEVNRPIATPDPLELQAQVYLLAKRGWKVPAELFERLKALEVAGG